MNRSGMVVAMPDKAGGRASALPGHPARPRIPDPEGR